MRNRAANSGFAAQASLLDQSASTPAVYADWKSGIVLRLFAAESDDTWSLNLKKGVTSLFQVPIVCFSL